MHRGGGTTGRRTARAPRLPARLGLVVAALRWRRASSTAVLLAAVTAFAAAGLGPLWATASQDALGSEAVRTAEVVERQVVVERVANRRAVGTLTVPVVARREVETLAAAVGAPADVALGPARVLLATSGRVRVRSETGLGLSVLAWTDDVCGRLQVVRGGCGPGLTDVVVSDRTARLLGLSVGETVAVPDLAVEPERPGSGQPFPTALRVTGVYRTGPAERARWSDTQLFRTAPPRSLGGEVLPARLDAVFAPRLPLLEDLTRTELTASARRAVLPADRTADELAGVEDALQRWRDDVDAGRGGVEVTSPALDLLAELRDDGAAARLAALLLGAQLLALSCCVLALVVAGSADARAPDVALGRLRGLRRRSLVVLGAAEPLLLVLLAAPVGVLVGAAVTAALAAAVLPGDVALRPDPVLAVALGVALVLALLAVGVGARRVLARGVLGVADERGGGTARLLGDAVVVTVAALAVFQVTRDGTPDGTGLLAPVLGAVAAGLLLARAGRVLAGPFVRRTAAGAGVAGWLAARRTARVDGGARTVVLTAAALSCACYAAVVLVVTDDQRGAQAAMEVGARTAYAVAPVEVDDLLAGVAAADPSGGRLLAAVRTPVRGDRAPVLAVDAGRLAAVAAWRQEWASRPLAELAAGLSPPVSAPVVLTGAQVAVDVDVRRLESAGAVLGLRVVAGDGTSRVLSVGTLVRGQSRLVTALDCPGGCRLDGLVLGRGRGASLVGEVVVQRLTVDGRAVEGALDPADWRPAPFDRRDPLSPASASLPGPDPGGLVVRFAQSGVDEVGVLRADVPVALPVLLAGSTPTTPAGRDGLLVVPVRSEGLLLGEEQGRARVLPRIAGSGYLVDLALLQRALPDELADAEQEVWSAGPPDPAVEAALDAAGLQVVATTTSAQREAELGGRGPARVLALLPVLAVVALALAVLGQVAEALAGARPRAVEAAGLQAVGVPRRALRRAAAREAVVLVGLGTAAGAVAGVATALLTAPAVGGLGLRGPLAPFDGAVPWTPVLGAVGVGAVLLLVVALACSRTGLGRRDPQLLRQAVA